MGATPYWRKPAEQTPLIAAKGVRALWDAGVPRLPCSWCLPEAPKMVAGARVRGVLFTGSTEVARILRRTIAGRIDTMRTKRWHVHQVAGRSECPLNAGTFVLPTLIEFNRLSELECEVFGPVLHFVRFVRDLEALLAQINGTGYGLTVGLHARITARRPHWVIEPSPNR